jgi:hypothetical protein
MFVVEQIVHSEGPYPSMRQILLFHFATSAADTASPPRIMVFKVGRDRGTKVLANEGVENIQLTFILFTAPGISFIRSKSLGIQIVPPTINVVKISMMAASKVNDANCRTLDVENICIPLL